MPGSILLFAPGVILFLAVLAVPVSVCAKYVKQQKREALSTAIAEDLEESSAMKAAMDMLTDFSHLSVHGNCLLYIATGQADCHIETELLLIDDGSFSTLQFILHDFERSRADAIGKSISGLITRDEMSSQVHLLEDNVNQMLVSNLLNKQQPMSYPFLHLREFLKPAENDNMEIKYPIVLESKMRDYRQIFLQVLKEKSVTEFSNCTVQSSDASSLVLAFTPT